MKEENKILGDLIVLIVALVVLSAMVGISLSKNYSLTVKLLNILAIYINCRIIGMKLNKLKECD